MPPLKVADVAVRLRAQGVDSARSEILKLNGALSTVARTAAQTPAGAAKALAPLEQRIAVLAKGAQQAETQAVSLAKLAGVESGLAAALGRSNLTLAQRVSLTELLAKAQGVRTALDQKAAAAAELQAKADAKAAAEAAALAKERTSRSGRGLDAAVSRAQRGSTEGLDALGKRIKLAAEGVQFDATRARSLETLDRLEAVLTKQLSAGNVTLEQRIKLEGLLARARAARPAPPPEPAPDAVPDPAGGVRGLLGKLTPALGGVARVAGGVLAAAGIQASLSAVIGLVKDAGANAGDAEEKLAGLSTAVRNAGQDFGAWAPKIDATIDQLQNLTTVEDDEARGALTTMVTVTKSVGGSLANLGLAADLAAAKHIGLNDAALLVGKAMIGNVTALQRQGITVRDSAHAVDELRARFGGFAAQLAQTNGGQLKQAAVAWGNLKEALGNVLFAAVGAAGGFGGLRDAIRSSEQWVTQHASGIQALTSVIVGAVKGVALLAGGILKVIGVAGDWLASHKSVISVIGTAATAGSLVFGLAKAKLALDGLGLTSIPGLIGAIGRLRTAIVALDLASMVTPVGIVAAAIALVAGGIAYLATGATRETEKLRTAVQTLSDAELDARRIAAQNLLDNATRAGKDGQVYRERIALIDAEIARRHALAAAAVPGATPEDGAATDPNTAAKRAAAALEAVKAANAAALESARVTNAAVQQAEDARYQHGAEAFDTFYANKRARAQAAADAEIAAMQRELAATRALVPADDDARVKQAADVGALEQKIADRKVARQTEVNALVQEEHDARLALALQVRQGEAQLAQLHGDSRAAAQADIDEQVRRFAVAVQQLEGINAASTAKIAAFREALTQRAAFDQMTKDAERAMTALDAVRADVQQRVALHQLSELEGERAIAQAERDRQAELIDLADTMEGLALTLKDPDLLAKARALFATIKGQGRGATVSEQKKSTLDELLKRNTDAAQSAGLELGQSFAGAMVGSIEAGFSALASGKGIGGAFKALGTSLLGGLGSAIKAFGEKALMASALMKSLLASFNKLNPTTAAIAAIGLIALGSLMEGAAGAFSEGGASRGGGVPSVTSYAGTAGGTPGTQPYTIGDPTGTGRYGQPRDRANYLAPVPAAPAPLAPVAAGSGSPAPAVTPVQITHVSLGTLSPTQKREFAEMYLDAARQNPKLPVNGRG